MRGADEEAKDWGAEGDIREAFAVGKNDTDMGEEAPTLTELTEAVGTFCGAAAAARIGMTAAATLPSDFNFCNDNFPPNSDERKNGILYIW